MCLVPTRIRVPGIGKSSAYSTKNAKKLMNIDALRGGVAPYLFEFECLLAWRFLRRAVAMFSIQFRTEARRERFARKVVEAAYCVASHREDRKCSFEAPIINISLPGWQSQWTNF